MALAVMNYTGWYGDFDGTGWKPYVISASSAGVVQNFAANNVDGVAVSATVDKPVELAEQFLFNGTSWDRARKANAVSRLMSSAATTNATLAKNSAGDLKKITGLKATAVNCFLKIYNKASAPTVGTDTPVFTLPLMASSAFNFDFGDGYYFSTGIAWAITLLSTDADTTAIAAGDVLALTIAYA